MIHKVKAVTQHIFLSLLIVIAISLSLVRFFLWGVESYKTELENKIYQMTEIPVEIGVLRAGMRGFNPEIVLKNIEVLTPDKQTSPAIELEQVRLGINLMDLIWSQQLLPSSWVTLVGVKLSIVRKEDGSLSIAGLNSNESEQPFWLLKGGRYEVLKSEITWLDQQRHAAPLVFDNVDLLIKNQFDSEKHEIHLLSQLPRQVGEALRVSMSIEGNVFETDSINGLVYIKGSDIQFAEILTGEQPLGLKINAGSGDFELWSQWQKSKNVALLANVQAKNVSIKKQQQVFKFDSLQSDFNGFKRSLGWQFGVSDFVASTAGKTWPPASFNVAVNNEITQFSTVIKQLDIQLFSELSRFFAPLEPQLETLLSKLELKGQINDFSAYIDTEKHSYAFSGVFNNIFSSAYTDFPQIKNLTASVHGSNESGILAFHTKQGSLYYPDVFRAPFLIKQLRGGLTWQQQADQWLVKSDYLLLNIKDAETESKLFLTIPKNESAAFIDLQSSFSKLDDVSAIPQYYPERIMGKDTLEWLDNAFVAGKIERGRLLLYGELNQFPYLQGQGVFEVVLDATELELQVSSDWPNLKNITAEILFEKESLTVTANHAEVSGLNITHTIVKIPSFENSQYLLAEGLAEGGLADGLKYLQQTPIHADVDQFLDAVQPSGHLNLELDFKVPLVDEVDAVVDGVAHLKQTTLNIKAIDLNVSDVEGDLSFTEKGLFSENIRAKALGYPIKIAVDNDDFNTSISVTGKTAIKELKKQFGFFNAEMLAKGRLRGVSNYQLKLELPAVEGQSAKLNLKTNLIGISSRLPGLLNKSGAQNKKLNLSLLLNDKELLPLSLNYNNAVKVAMNIDKQQNELHSAHIVYGHGRAIVPKQKGIKINVEKDAFDMAAWSGVLASPKKQQSKLKLNEISIITKDLQWKDNHYGPFEIATKRFGKQWRGNLTCSAAKGAFVVPVNHSDKDKIKLEMAYLNLAELLKIDFQTEGFESKDMPLIDVFSEQFFWGKANLGALEIITERVPSGLRFKQIDISAKDHKIEMTADWIKQGQESLTDFQGTLSANDMGGLLSQLGKANDLKESSANITFAGRWPKAPYQFSLSELDAELDLQLEDGRISSIEPGLGRVLGLIAMEQWIKRLTLDFGDLYKKGLSFNSIKGSFNITKGIAHTTDLMVDAIPAQITLVGEADLLTQTLDQHIRVVPKSSGALPIAGTIVGRIAGTITQAVTSDYKEGYFFGSEYHVTGKWDDIKVKALHEQDGVLKKTWSGLMDFSWMNPVTE